MRTSLLGIALVTSAVAAGAADSSSCRASLPATLGELHAQKPKPKVDYSTAQLFYEMAQSDGTGMAEVPVGSFVEQEYCAQVENSKPQPGSQQKD